MRGPSRAVPGASLLMLPLVLSLGLSLVGCAGFEEETPLSVLAAAESDMADLSSMRLRTTEYAGGVKETRDLVVTRAGDCAGTVTTAGASVQVLRVSGEVWIRPDEGYWPLVFEGPLVANLGDTWIRLTSSAELDRFCDIDAPYRAFVGSPRDLTWLNTGPGELAGVAVVRLEGARDDGTRVGVAVTVDEPHRIVAMELGGAGRGSAELYGFDDGTLVEPPDPGDVVQVDDLR
ncbi:hypothetical protein [Nocardioides psychrotolerans]|uniref:Lipoprotein LprG n=1 Tax=Nocardioides psychrotolerans TaxID=1005945 RepID=A0A1I3E3K1_9ACTN|nr:hypothetical protein [Nocardioides psychrotolerans]SFH93383.1 hypothetical protein SAMN05216561_103198 [Nocardioides psychrotolerans]